MMRLVSSAALALLLLGGPALAGAETIQERFQSANGQYFKKDYKGAGRAYRDLVERYNLRDAVLYYNLGNANYMQGDLGLAILSYKRALETDPDDAFETKIRDNLDRCVEALIDRHRKDVGSVTVLDETHGVVYSIFQLAPPTALATVFGLLWLAFFGVLITRRLPPLAGRRASLRTARRALLLPLIIVGVLFVGNAVTADSVVRGIVIKDNVQLRDGKHPDAPASDVPEGLEVRIVDQTDPNETRIRLSNGKEGWVSAEAVEAI
ncbi:MAG: hypothetical protein ACI9WU_002771 [Myxococcota bacterium]|jgi:hypothetical protein